MDTLTFTMPTYIDLYVLFSWNQHVWNCPEPSTRRSGRLQVHSRNTFPPPPVTLLFIAVDEKDLKSFSKYPEPLRQQLLHCSPHKVGNK